MPKVEQEEHRKLRQGISLALRHHFINVLPTASNPTVLEKMGDAFLIKTKTVMDEEQRSLPNIEKFRTLVIAALNQAATENRLQLELPENPTTEQIVAAFNSLLEQRKRS